MLKKDYKKQAEELEDILKAIINKFGARQIIITKQEIENVKHCKIYVTKELFRNGKKYELIDEHNILHSYKEEESKR